MDCIHWSILSAHVGKCAIGAHGGKPSLGVCETCQQRVPAGDAPNVALARVGKPSCQGCGDYKGDAGGLGVHCGRLGNRSCSNIVPFAGACPVGRWGELAKPRAIRPPAEHKSPFLNAADLPSRYLGASAFLICGGPSLATMDLAKLRQPGIMTFGVNNSVKTYRPDFWTHVDSSDRFLRSAFLDPRIMKFTPAGLQNGLLFDSDKWEYLDTRVKDCPNVVYYGRHTGFNPSDFLQAGSICWGNEAPNGGGRSVMLVALRLLYELGFRRVFIIGADFKMSAEHTYAFRQSRAAGAVANNTKLYQILNERFAALRPHFEAAGFHVYNCTPGGGLTAFPRMSYELAIEAAKLPVDVERENTEGLYDREKPAPKPAAKPIAPNVPAIDELKPDITVITPTGDRPQAFALAEKWMARQNFAGRVQWIVVDDGVTPTLCTRGQEHIRRERLPTDPAHTLPVNLLAGLQAVRADRVIIWEDDDWYREDYIKVVAERLREADLVGEDYALYYRPDMPGFRHMPRRGTCASLAATAFTRAAIPTLESICRFIKSPSVDFALWEQFAGKKRVWQPNESHRLIVQMKALPGRRGTLLAHRTNPSGFVPDPGMMVLRRQIGEDADEYERLVSNVPRST